MLMVAGDRGFSAQELGFKVEPGCRQKGSAWLQLIGFSLDAADRVQPGCN